MTARKGPRLPAWTPTKRVDHGPMTPVEIPLDLYNAVVAAAGYDQSDTEEWIVRTLAGGVASTFETWAIEMRRAERGLGEEERQLPEERPAEEAPAGDLQLERRPPQAQRSTAHPPQERQP